MLGKYHQLQTPLCNQFGGHYCWVVDNWHHAVLERYNYITMQSQKAESGYLKSKQMLIFLQGGIHVRNVYGGIQRVHKTPSVGAAQRLMWLSKQEDSISVYCVAVRTIVLSRHGSNLTRPVIIHDIIYSLMGMPSTPHCGFSGVSLDGNCAYVHWGSLTSNSKSVRRAIWFTWFSEPHDTTSLHDVLVYTAPGSPRRLSIQLLTRRDVA